VQFVAFRSFFDDVPGHVISVDDFRDRAYLLDLLGTELSYVVNAFPTEETAWRFIRTPLPAEYYIYPREGHPKPAM
jgi:hypothetical protein